MRKKKESTSDPEPQDLAQATLFVEDDPNGAHVHKPKEVVSAKGSTILAQKFDAEQLYGEEDDGLDDLSAWSNQGSNTADMILTENGYVAPDYNDEDAQSEIEILRAVRSYYAHIKNENVPLVSLTDTVVGSETRNNVKFAVCYHGAIKVLIPCNKISIPTQQSIYAAEMSAALAHRKRTKSDIPDMNDPAFVTEIRNRVVNRIMGVEITYCIRDYNEVTGEAVGSRTDSMRCLARKFSLDTKVNGDYKIGVGTRIRARIVATYRLYLVACFGGIEMSIERKRLTPRFMRSLRDMREYAPNNSLDLVITECERDADGVITSITAEAANLKTRASALSRVSANQKYCGYISRIDRTGVIVRILNNSVECRCSIINNSDQMPRRGDMAFITVTSVDAEHGNCKGYVIHVETGRGY